MHSRSVASVGLLMSAVALIASREAEASPQDLFAYGARSVAMGGTGATFADDYSAVHANPAGLVRAPERALTLGFMGGSYSLQIARGSDPAEHHHVDLVRGTTIGLTLPLPFGGVLRNRLAIGLGFYTPTDVVVRGRILRPETPQFLVIADRAQSVALQLGLGADLGFGFRAGVGFAALAAIVGSVVIATDSTGRVGSRVDNQLVASYAPVVGASWDHGPFRVGAVYRGELIGRFGVTIEARDIGLPLPVFNISGIAQYDPWQVAGEIGFAQRPWTLAIGFTYKGWGAYPGPLERTTMTSLAPPPVNFHDTIVVRAGAEYKWTWPTSHFALRGGYFYEPTPVPEATGESNYLDNDRHVGTLGFSLGGRALGTLLTLDVFGQGHYLGARTSTKDPTVSPGNPGAPSLTYGGAMYLLGLTATVTF